MVPFINLRHTVNRTINGLYSYPQAPAPRPLTMQQQSLPTYPLPSPKQQSTATNLQHRIRATNPIVHTIAIYPASTVPLCSIPIWNTAAYVTTAPEVVGPALNKCLTRSSENLAPCPKLAKARMVFPW